MNNRSQTRHSHMYLELHSTGTHGMQNESSSPGVTHSTGFRTVEVKGMRNCTDIKKGEDIRYRSLHSYWRNIRNQRKVHNCSIRYRHTYWYILDIIVQFLYDDQIKKLLWIILWTINRSEHIRLYTIRYILLMLHYLLTGNIILWYKGGSIVTNLVEKCKSHKKHYILKITPKFQYCFCG